jgi:membrane protease subunit (stomatin/prohibitin family)
MARVGVAAGTATAVSNRVSRRQADRWSEQDQGSYEEAPPQQAAPPQDDTLEQLQKLGELKASGVLTEAEFEAQKAKIIAG